MNTSRSIFATPFACIALVAGSAMIVGCTAASESESTTDSVQEALVDDDSGEMSIPTENDVRFERSGDSIVSRSCRMHLGGRSLRASSRTTRRKARTA